MAPLYGAYNASTTPDAPLSQVDKCHRMITNVTTISIRTLYDGCAVVGIDPTSRNAIGMPLNRLDMMPAISAAICRCHAF